jgi:hypothetical protein
MDAGNSMAPRSGYVSALGAFWPAMQVLYGDIDGAQMTFQCTCQQDLCVLIILIILLCSLLGYLAAVQSFAGHLQYRH